MNLVNFGTLIGSAIADTWMSIWLSINSMVYSIIELLYRVFVAVANVNLFSQEVFDKIIKRVYIVMGVAMLFIFAYNLVLMIINPDDKKGTGQMTKMIKETIISLVLIVLLPTIFNYMSIFQRHVLDSNILGQIILGDVGGATSKDEITTYCEKYKNYTIIGEKTDIGKRKFNWSYVAGGTTVGALFGGVGAAIGGGGGLIVSLADYFSQESKDANDELYKGCLLFNAKSASSRGAATIAPTIYSAFYHPTNYGYFECADFIENGVGKYDSYTTNYIKENEDKEMCSYYYYVVNMAKFTGSISAFNNEEYFYNKVKKDDGTFEFNYMLALVAGVLALYMFACYTMSIGVRVAKLGFLQIISPIAVMMRIIPKKKEAIYDKWQKMLLETYLDVFIRLTIIYFSLFAISLVPDVIHSLAVDEGGFAWLLACVVVILGILKFAQDAPGLFKDFFGGSGSFALKRPKKQFQENKLGSAALGLVGGGLSSAAGNIWNSGKNVIKTPGVVGKAKALGKGIVSTASGTLGGAVRGAKKSYGSTGLKDLGRNIAEAKYATDAAQLARSEASKKDLKYRALKAKKKAGDVWGRVDQFLTGSGASNFKLQAVEGSLKDIQNINANFKNGKIEGLESAYSKMNDDYNNNKPLNFNGRQYERKENGWVNKNNSNDVLSHDAMGKAIKDHFDALKKSEYVSQYVDNEKAFERLTSKMIDTLNDNLPKIGSDVLDGINKKLENTGIKFNDLDEITTKIGDLMKDGNKAAIYDINDALEKNLKNVKKEVIVAQQEKKEK